MSDFHWILPELAVGGAVVSEEALRLLAEAHALGAIVDCRSEACDPIDAVLARGIAFLHLPTPDGAGLVQSALDRGVAWVNARLGERRKTLIHCQYGMGRSALLSLCVLVSRGHRPLEAFVLARTRRPVITLSTGQMEAYRGWLTRQHGDWEVPSLAALSEISWGSPPKAGP